MASRKKSLETRAAKAGRLVRQSIVLALMGSVLAIAPAQAAAYKVSPAPISAASVKVGSWNICNHVCEGEMGSVASRASRYASGIVSSGVSVVALQETNASDGASIVKSLGSSWVVSPSSVENMTIIYNKTVWSPTSATGSALKYGTIVNATTESKKKSAYQGLRHLASGEEILFIDIHFHWGATGPTFNEHRAGQALKVVEAAKTIAGDMPVIIAGDTNSTYMPNYRDSKSLYTIENAGFKSISKTSESFNPGFTTGTFNGGTVNRYGKHIDHIFIPLSMTSKAMKQYSNPDITDHNLVWTELELAAPPTITVAADSDPKANIGNFSISGTAPAGKHVAVSEKVGATTTQIGKVIAENDGTWTFTAPITAAGSHTFTAKTVGFPTSTSRSSSPAVVTVGAGATPPSTTIPKYVEGITASNITSTSATLSWTPVYTAVKYRVYVKTTSSMSSKCEPYCTVITPSDLNSPSTRLTGLKASTTHYVKISAINSAGKTITSWQSKPTSFKTTSTSASTESAGSTSNAFYSTGPSKVSTIAETTATSITNLRTTRISSDSTALAWNPIKDAVEYRVYYMTGSVMPSACEPNCIVVNASNLNTPFATIAGLSPDTIYYVKVAGIDAAGKTLGTWSSPISFRSAESTDVKDIVATDVTANTATVSWAPVEGAAKYRIYYKNSSDMPSSCEPYCTVVSTNSASLTGLSAKTSYYVKVAAIDVNGDTLTYWQDNAYRFSTN